MQQMIRDLEQQRQRPQIVDVRSGDTVRVSQRIEEGGKSRLQVFEGLVIRTDRKNSLTGRITVRRIASGVGVEKSFLLHSPLVEKVEVIKRSKVRRNYLSYMRQRAGKAARLSGIDFDKEAVNTIEQQQDEDAGLAGDQTEQAAPDHSDAEPQDATTGSEDAAQDKPATKTETKKSKA